MAPRRENLDFLQISWEKRPLKKPVLAWEREARELPRMSKPLPHDPKMAPNVPPQGDPMMASQKQEQKRQYGSGCGFGLVFPP